MLSIGAHRHRWVRRYRDQEPGSLVRSRRRSGDGASYSVDLADARSKCVE